MIEAPPSNIFLSQYYSNQLPYIFADFDLYKRCDFIDSLFDKDLENLNVLDYGSNSKQSFHNLLEARGVNVSLHDLNPTYQKTQGQYDRYNLISSYFCLEHMLNPSEFFLFAREHIEDDGYVIIEVHDASIYEKKMKV